MKRTVLTTTTYFTDNTLIDRQNGSYVFKQIDKYNNIEKYAHGNDIKIQEMPETLNISNRTHISNIGIVVIRLSVQVAGKYTLVIYDLFAPPSEETELDSLKRSDSFFVEDYDFYIRNKINVHSVVCKSEEGYLKPQCNIIYYGTPNYGDIDMDLPSTFTPVDGDKNYNEFYEQDYKKFNSTYLDNFYIKPKQYLYVSLGEPELITEGIYLIKCTENLWYIANITTDMEDDFIQFNIKYNSDCIVEFM